MWVRKVVALGLIVGVAVLQSLAPVQAATFQPPMDKSEWLVDTSIFECRMTHAIPFYGDAIFIRRAGESPLFNLTSKTPRLGTGQASLVAEPPLWRPGVKARHLAMVPVTQGPGPLELGPRLTEQMLAELYAGMRVVLTRKPWYGADESVRVGMSSVNFRGAYRQYLDCLASLLPVNFDQIQRTAIYFPSGHDMLKPSEMQKLDNIITYVNADPTVEAFFIDGHTDSAGERAENLDLSKRRAEMVSEYLRLKGVPEDRITTRWHGERYPVEANLTRQGRAQNRRVTIRLEKANTPKVPALASKAVASGS